MLPAQAKNQSGQILVIFLLVLVVGLAITLSIASRTVTDIRQTTTSDESNRSYFAAESGVEKALRLIEDNPGSANGTYPNYADLTDVNRSSADVTIGDFSVPDISKVFEFPNDVSQDDVVQVSLMSNFDTLTTAGIGTGIGGSFLNTDSLNIYFDTVGSPNTGINTPAIEVSIITCSRVAPAACSSSSSFDIKKMVFDISNRSNFNNSCISTPSPIITQNGDSRSYKYQAALVFNAACGNNDTVSSNNDAPVMARIRALYNGTPMKIAVGNSTKLLPAQGKTITSTGKTLSGVTRKLVVTRLYPSLPAIFDYVLFNGSSSALTK